MGGFSCPKTFKPQKKVLPLRLMRHIRIMRYIILLLLALLPSVSWGQDVKSVLDRMHQVRKGETIQSVAAMYGVTEEEIRAANPEIRKKRKLKKGTFLSIPARKEVIETIPVVQEDEKPVAKEEGPLRVCVLLPIEEKSERGGKMLEFYQGFLMAADSVKKEKRNLEIYTWNSGSTADDMDKLIEANRPVMAKADFIFGPADVEQIPALATFCMDNNVRLVLPFANTTRTDSPLVYHATAGIDVAAAGAAKMIVGHNVQKNYIILRTDAGDKKGQAFTTEISRLLAGMGVNTRTLDINGDDFAYETALNQFQENCIIPDNAGIKTLNILVSRLNELTKEHPEYSISLFGYPEWQTYTNTLLGSFYKYNTYTYCTYYFNPFAEKTDSFQKSFLANFGKPVMVNFPRYAAMGFDLGYYFMHDGDTPDAFQHSFRFNNDVTGGDMQNTFVQLIHYTPEEKIEQIR